MSFYIRNEREEDVTVLEIEKTYYFGLLVKFHEDLDNGGYNLSLIQLDTKTNFTQYKEDDIMLY